jgi:hypothetical protein
MTRQGRRRLLSDIHLADLDVDIAAAIGERQKHAILLHRLNEV